MATKNHANTKDTVLRSIVKTFFFKVVTTSVTACFTGIGKAITIHLILTAVYLIYERIWNRINWGKKVVTNQPQEHVNEVNLFQQQVLTTK